MPGGIKRKLMELLALYLISVGVTLFCLVIFSIVIRLIEFYLAWAREEPLIGSTPFINLNFLGVSLSNMAVWVCIGWVVFWIPIALKVSFFKSSSK